MEGTSKKALSSSSLKDSSKKVIIKFKPEEDGCSGSLSRTIKTQHTIDAERKGPTTIIRTIDLNEGIEIKRRFGEGKRPLFERDDVKVNAVVENNTIVTHTFKYLKVSSPPRSSHDVDKKRSPASPRKDIEKIKTSGKHEDVKYSKSNVDDYKRKDLKSRLSTEVQQRNKLPYFSDPVREQDRIRQLYGDSRRRSRSRTPEHSRKRSSHRSRHLDNSPRRRSISRDRHRSHSPYRSSRRYHTRRKSRSRSPKRDRPSHRSPVRSSRERQRDNNECSRVIRDEPNRMIPPSPYIPIPVGGIPDYTCPYHGPPQIWAHQVTRHPPPSPYYRHYPIVPFPAMRPPPHQTAYGSIAPAIPLFSIHPASYRPHPARYPPPRQNLNSYQIRNKKPSS